MSLREAHNWTQQAYIKASNTDQLTYSAGVSLSGDTLAVGASQESSSAKGIGGRPDEQYCHTKAARLHAFTRNGTIWTQQAYLKAVTRCSASLRAIGVLFPRHLAVGARGESVTPPASATRQISAYQAGSLCVHAGGDLDPAKPMSGR